MKTASETRAENLILLRARYDTVAAFCKAIDMAQAQFSQLKSYLDNPRPSHAKGMGEKLARKIETALHLPRGWMDRVHDAGSVRDVDLTVAPATPTPAPKRGQRGQLSPIQTAALDTASRLMAARLLTDTDCIMLLQNWQPLVEKLQSSERPVGAPESQSDHQGQQQSVTPSDLQSLAN